MRWWSSFALTAAVLCVGQSSNRTYGYSKGNKTFWLTCFKDLYASILSTRMSYPTRKSLLLEDDWVIACIASISMWFHRAKNEKLESKTTRSIFGAAKTKKSHFLPFLCLSLLWNHMETLATQTNLVKTTMTLPLYFAL